MLCCWLAAGGEERSPNHNVEVSMTSSLESFFFLQVIARTTVNFQPQLRSLASVSCGRCLSWERDVGCLEGVCFVLFSASLTQALKRCMLCTLSFCVIRFLPLSFQLFPLELFATENIVLNLSIRIFLNFDPVTLALLYRPLLTNAYHALAAILPLD